MTNLLYTQTNLRRMAVLQNEIRVLTYKCQNVAPGGILHQMFDRKIKQLQERYLAELEEIREDSVYFA